MERTLVLLKPDAVQRGLIGRILARFEEKGLKQIADDSSIRPICEEIVAANPGQVEQYRGGKQALFGFFVGQVMKQTKGKANPKMVNEILKELLDQ